MDRAFDAVICDMDGVLCDSEPLIRAAAQEMFRRRFGVALADAEFQPFVGAGEDRFLGGPAEGRGLCLDMPADKELTYDIYLTLIRGVLRPLPGAVAFVRQAAAGGLRLALASAADRRKVTGNLEAIGLGQDAFHALITGNDVVRKKPHPDGFLLAAQRLGVRPERALVVEDAVNGVQAAVAAGSACLALTTSFPAERLTAAGARYLAPHLGAIPADCLAALGLG